MMHEPTNIMCIASTSLVDFVKIEIKRNIKLEITQAFRDLFDSLRLGYHFELQNCKPYDRPFGLVARYVDNAGKCSLHSIILYFTVWSKESGITQTHFIVYDFGGYVKRFDDKCYTRLFVGMHPLRDVLYPALKEGSLRETQRLFRLIFKTYFIK